MYRARCVGRVVEIPCILQEYHPPKQLDMFITPEALQTLLIRVVMEALLCIEDKLLAISERTQLAAPLPSTEGQGVMLKVPIL